jgi:hypothetical protein
MLSGKDAIFNIMASNALWLSINPHVGIHSLPSELLRFYWENMAFKSLQE